LEKIVRTVCQGSHSECGVLVHVKDGKVTKVEGDPEHPMNRGFICVKGRAQPQLVYHPDRLKYPLERVGDRGEGKWRRVSWDEALNAIAQKLTGVKEKYGTKSIAAIHGTGPRPTSFATDFFCLALGSPNVISVDLHICAAPSAVAESYTVGHPIMMREAGPDYRAANCILVWGGNPLVSHPPRGMDIIEAKRKREAKLIVIDPRRTPLAAEADLWLQVRPGTDVALAMGMINAIINEELYDREFVDKWCYGFDKLSERAKEYPPEKVAEITWIPSAKIKEAARLYAMTKPAAFHHRVGVEQNINSTQTGRALIILVALTGNIDVEGGNLLPMDVEGYVPFFTVVERDERFRLSPEVAEKRIGSREYPLISGPGGGNKFVHAPLAVEAMLTGKPYPIKALYCAGANPIVGMQDSRRVWRALKSLELLMVSDFFMTPTAELADYVLPAAAWLERDECCDMMYMNYISARQKVIEPLFECRDDMNITIELVKRIPWANRKSLPWNDIDELNEWRVQGMGITFDDFKNKGYVVVPRKYKKYEAKGFNTPTGKVELYSTTFEKYGYDPLPSFREPPESPVSTPQLMKDYPLILFTGGRNLAYFASEGRQLPRLRRLVPDPEAEIHPDTAKEAGIKDGDWIWIETPRVKGERVKLKAKLTENVHRRMVHVPHGWWFPERPAPEHGCFDSNINVVTSGDPPREQICGSVPTRGTLCRIYR